ncbi:TPA: O-antigen ligase family protein [Bacillus cereus]|nr:O-antigen ligase family protein [Bacillus cereus]HDV8360449.1 O-antigen ligase family protein [Bacillus cereus]
MAFIASNLYLNIDTGGSIVYVHSLLMVLIFYLFAIKIVLLKVRGTSIYKDSYFKIVMALTLVNLIFVYQFLFINKLEPILFVRTWVSYLCIQLLIIVLYNLSKKGLAEYTVINSILIFSFFNSILSILQFITNKTLLIGNFNNSINYTEGLMVVKRVVGFVGANNGAGNLAAILYPVLLYALVKRRNLYTLVVFILNVIFVILTLTRVGMLAIIVSTIIYYIFTQTKSKEKILGRMLSIASMALMLGLFYVLYGNKLIDLLFKYRGETGDYRLYQFEFAGNLIKENLWFGIGAGNFNDIVSIKFNIPQIGILHSQWLNIIVEQGIISFLLIMIINLIIFLRMIRVYNKQNLWLPLSLFLGNAIVINANANQYYEINNFIFYFIVCGLLFSKHENSRNIMK